MRFSVQTLGNTSHSESGSPKSLRLTGTEVHVSKEFKGGSWGSTAVFREQQRSIFSVKATPYLFFIAHFNSQF